MGLLDQILGGMVGGQGGLGGMLGGSQGRDGQGAGGGLGGVLGDLLNNALSGQQGAGQQGSGQLGPGQQGLPQQPQGPQTSGGGMGGLNPILIAVLGMLASRAIGGMMQGGSAQGGQNSAAPQGQGGGLDGLLEQFRRGGMGSAFDSWVGTGTNQSVNPQQLEQMLGKDSIHDLACKMGISDSEACKQVADVLPDVVDRLTPNGQAPANGFGDVGSMLERLLRQSR